MRITKKVLFVLVTAATALSALELTAQMGAGDPRLPAQEWLLGMIAAVVISTGLLWMRLGWAVALAVVSYLAFGCIHAWMIYGVIQSGNYSGPAILVVLAFIGLCPFAAAFITSMWGIEFCRRVK
jgi:ribose/xylose/arabinose/galactoside ABC-type transport system permease subunit